MTESAEVSRDAVLDALLVMLPVMPMARPASPHGRTVAEMATEHMLLLRQERDQLVDALRAIDSAHALAAADAASLRSQIDEARLVSAAQEGPTDASRGLVWTAARRDLLRERFPQCRDDEALRQELNRLPGLLPVATMRALRSHAAKIGITRDRGIVHEMRTAGAAEANARRLAHNGGRPRTWTSERDERLRAEFGRVASIHEMRDRLNELPGTEIKTAKAVRERAKRLRLRLPIEVTLRRKRDGGVRGSAISRDKALVRPGASATLAATQPGEPVIETVALPEPEPERTPEQSAAIADSALARKHKRVRQSLQAAMKRGKGSVTFEAAAAIAANHGLPAREVMRLVGELRAEGYAA